MEYLLSTKYKLGKITLKDSIVTEACESFKNLIGHEINEVIEIYNKQCNKTELKQKRNTVRLIQLKEAVDNGN